MPRSIDVIVMLVAPILHAALPNHWLPFVLIGRALQWSRARTLSVLAIAGSLHVIVTGLLGVLVWWIGATVKNQFEWFHETGAWLASGLLIGLGALYTLLHLRGGHAHGHHVHSHAASDQIYADEHVAHEHAHETAAEHAAHAGRARAKAISERGAIATLLVALTVSPCGAIVPLLAGMTFGGFLPVVGAALAAALVTVAVMALLVWLTLIGVEKLEAPWLDRNELLVTGGILIALGIAVLALH
jgi:hypothetical protein